MNAYRQFPPPGPGPGVYGSPFHPYGRPPENNLVWGIVATVVFCMPIGIVSLVKASRVNNLWAQGRFDEAHRAARSAKTWAIWSAVIWVVGLMALVVAYFAFWAAVVATTN
ncbi:CD225/dispanin family protein [Rhodococcus artemisiae]|uniref:CD225/dispanin family protein n=1 Tax=Rhodococcus artemisiae TaxID=714159 RepID=A0ABU7LFC5_9NOCA|nr:CD225/dispanin family protein [Rhodococcus artemisiae]MEE2060233.1 CD225/dispanin family protein [Rhodococcus artemisiae]